MNQFDKVVATFRPTHTLPLRQDAIPWIGFTATWQAVWWIEDGAYAGQWAMAPVYFTCPGGNPPFAWVPECDLSIDGEGV